MAAPVSATAHQLQRSTGTPHTFGLLAEPNEHLVAHSCARGRFAPNSSSTTRGTVRQRCGGDGGGGSCGDGDGGVENGRGRGAVDRWLLVGLGGWCKCARGCQVIEGGGWGGIKGLLLSTQRRWHCTAHSSNSTQHNNSHMKHTYVSIVTPTTQQQKAKQSKANTHTHTHLVLSVEATAAAAVCRTHGNKLASSNSPGNCTCLCHSC